MELKKTKKFYQKNGNSKSGNLTLLQVKIVKALGRNPSGLTASLISKVAKIPLNRTLYNNLGKLREKGVVENNRPIWAICHSPSLSRKVAQLLHSNKVQAHKFSFLLKLVNKPNWWANRSSKLIQLKEYHFKNVPMRSYTYQQLKGANFIINTYPNSIVFLNQKQYWGADSYECLMEAIDDVLSMIKYLEAHLNFELFRNATPQLSIQTNHYVKLQDAIAKKCEKDGDLFRLEINGELRAWIDMSKPFGTEFGNKKYGVEDESKYQNYVEDLIENNVPRPSKVWDEVNEMKRLQKEVMELIKGNSELEANNQMVIKQLSTNQEQIIQIIKEKLK